MRIVIIGDIHLYDLSFRPWQLLGKRLLGQVNLWTRRRHAFEPALLEPVLERAMTLEPDWVIFSGDLTTTALNSEFAMASAAIRKTLGPLFERGRVIAVPGNHDRYTFTATRRKLFEKHMGDAAPDAFPHVVDLTPKWRLIGIDSCCPRLINSRGRVGGKQLTKLEHIISQTPAGVGLLVVCHYPMRVPPDYHDHWSHQLEDADELFEVVGKALGPVVFVHGHIHRPWQWQPFAMGQGKLQMINAGSPCMTSRSYPAGQGFWSLELPTDSQGAGDVSAVLPLLEAHRPEYELVIDPETGVAARPTGEAGKALIWRILPQSKGL